MVIKVKNPATGEMIQEVKKDSEDEVKQAIQDLHHGFTKWSKVNAHERSSLLNAWAEKLRENKEEIAEILTKENGKPLVESMGELDYAISYIDWYAEEAKRIYGRTIPANTESKRIIISKQPLGPVAAITPWNFPAAMITRKVAPALAAGCTIIVKPAVETPLTAIRILDLAHKVGIPVDVLKYVNGSGSVIGDLFTESKYIRKITFTGSTPVGKILMKNSANTMKHVTMELGGHAPLIVAKDANLQYAAEEAIKTKFRNAGQTCISANRLIVHEDVVDDFSEKLTAETKKLKVGNGLSKDTDIGPIINQKGYDKINAQINDAVAKGAEILTGKQSKENDSNPSSLFISPTVLKNINEEMDIMNEETFGPVAPIISFKTLEEAVNIANNTPYGLAAYFFTNDYRTGAYLHEHLNFGIVGWNDGAPSGAHVPFGGMKESGLGREGGVEGIEAYLETKYLSIGNL